MTSLNKKLSTLRIILSIVLLIAGVLTVVFSILALAGKETIHPTTALRFVMGVTLCIFGIVNFAMAIIKDNDKAVSLSISAITLGVGIFLFLKEAGSLVDYLVGLAIPLIIACFGGIYLFKGIFDAVKKVNHRFVAEIILGAVLLTVGIVFTIFSKDLINVIWLIVGVGIIALSVVQLIFIARKRKTSINTNNATDAEVKEVKSIENKQ